MIIDNDIDLLAITETWLTSNDEIVVGGITPWGYTQYYDVPGWVVLVLWFALC